MGSNTANSVEKVVLLGRSMALYWCLVENIADHKLKAAKDPSSPDAVRSLFYDKAMDDPKFLDKAVEDWEPLLHCVIKHAVEPKLLDLQSALDRLNRAHEKKLLLNYVGQVLLVGFWIVQKGEGNLKGNPG